MFYFACNARLCFPCITCRYSVAIIAFVYVNTQVRYQSSCLNFAIRLVGEVGTENTTPAATGVYTSIFENPDRDGISHKIEQRRCVFSAKI